MNASLEISYDHKRKADVNNGDKENNKIQKLDQKENLVTQVISLNIDQIVGQSFDKAEISTSSKISQGQKSMEGIEVLHSDLKLYSKEIFKWFECICQLFQKYSSFDSEDRQVIKSSFNVINILVDKIDEAESKCRYFAAVDATSRKLYAFGIGNIGPNEGELLYLAADPLNLPLKDRIDKRVRGGGTEVIRTIASKTHSLIVKPGESSVKFYRGLGFVDKPSDHNNEVLKLNSEKFLKSEKGQKSS